MTVQPWIQADLSQAAISDGRFFLRQDQSRGVKPEEDERHTPPGDICQVPEHTLVDGPAKHGTGSGDQNRTWSASSGVKAVPGDGGHIRLSGLII